MICLNKLQFALDKQAPNILSVTTLHGDILLSSSMKQELEIALNQIINTEMIRQKKELTELMTAELALLEHQSVG
ncbi:MAG: hypothetical protein MJK10_00590 [Pseudomonadales bacterium]|nr:hypothetical protein [Pseudomonadales bacterium]NRA14375.1 hypothetical protein [Oceanospirillaceae bacterium]